MSLRSTCWILVFCSFAVLRTLGADSLWLDAARLSITNHELRGHVEVLADDMLEGREAGSRGGHAAARYLMKRLEEARLQPAGPGGAYTQSFQGRNQNLLAKLEGADPQLRGEYIVVGAHYDHVGYGTRRNSYGPWGFIHNGADDNASGVSALLEVIDAMSRGEYQPRRSILFCFWDGEEKGLLGSKHWSRQPTVPLSDVRLAINIDMVGRLVDGRIEVMGTRTGAGLRQLMSSTRLSTGTWLDYTWEIKDNSDHWTFFQANIPSLCLHTGVHDDYHRPSDDVEKINFEGMQEVSRYLLEQLCGLADADQLPVFRSLSRAETPTTQQQVEVPLPAIPSRLAFAWKYLAEEPNQVLVERVILAADAGEEQLMAGDRIIAVEGRPIVCESQLPAAALAGEAELSLEVLRAESEEARLITTALRGSPTRLGLSWRADSAEPGAVYVTRVVPYSPAARAGLKTHDRIYALSGETYADQQELFDRVQELLETGADKLQFLVESRGNLREVAVSLELPGTTKNDPTL